jgi:SAM-dependent methyltransferase
MRTDLDEYAATADLYDFVHPYRQRPDIAFFVEAATDAGGPVLELGCGTGRVLIPTARAGITITGLDASPHMLAVCRNRLGAEPESVTSRVTIVQADMRSFEIAQTFNLVTIPFRPFQHLLTTDDQLACLACIRRHLAPGGHLVFDLFNPWLEALVNGPFGEEFGAEPEFTMADGRRVIRCVRNAPPDRFQQIGHHELIYEVTSPDGRQERLIHAFRLRYFFRFEIEHLLARSGFVVEQIYSGFDKSPYGSTYPGELIVVATRP